jgi:hypothetical protein
MLFVLDHGAAAGDSRKAVRMLREHSLSGSTGAARRIIQLAVPGTGSIQQFPDTLTTGKLTHVAAIWRGGVGQLFIAGEPQTATAGSFNFAERQVPPYLWLGAIHSAARGPINCWPGQLQQVRLATGAQYSVAFQPDLDLSASPSTVALYRLDEDAGEILNDSSGHDRHATIVGPQWVRLELPPVPEPTHTAGTAAATSAANEQSVPLIPLLKPRRLADGRWENVSVRGDVITFDASDKERQIWHDFPDVDGIALTVRTRLRIAPEVPDGYTKLVLLNGVDPDHYLIVSDESGTLAAWLQTSNGDNLSTPVPITTPPGDFFRVELALREGRLVAALDGQTIADVKYVPQQPCQVALNVGGWKCEFDEPVVVFPATVDTSARTDAAVIEWVRSLGGLIRGTPAAGGYMTVNPADPLPPGEFSLHIVDLAGKAVTDADLSRFDRLPELGVLILGGVPVTDAGVTNLGHLPKLSALYLGGPGFGDAGLAEIAVKYPQLEILHCGESGVTNDGLGVLRNCPQLRSLSLYRSLVSDAAVDTLSQLTSLRTLGLTSTQVTQTGIDRLRAALPHCRIIWNGGEIPPENYALDLSNQGSDTPPRVLLPIDMRLTEPFTIECRVIARTLAHPREHRNVWHNRGCFELKQYGDRWHWAANGQEPVAYTIAKSEVAVSPGTPTYLAGVFTGTELLLFVDGKLSGRADFNVKFTGDTSQPLLGLGGKFDTRTPEEGGYSCFDGLIDEVRISTTARYSADYVPPAEFTVDADTLALYHCDEAGGAELRDQARSHHGQVVNGTWVRVEGVPPLPAGGAAP